MIELKGITKTYDLGHMQIEALKNINLEITRGEFITIMGPSGSGKSTLLHILGILDEADSGSYLLEKNDLTTLSDKELSRIRNQNFGFIFQSFNLFNQFNAMENVMFPLIQAGVPRAERRERTMSLLTSVGLEQRAGHYPNMLSGGEQQRVAIARALAMDPTFILADEPTGNLPSEQGTEVLGILDDLNKKGVTVIMVTHDDTLGERGTRAVRMRDGEIVKDFRRDA